MAEFVGRDILLDQMVKVSSKTTKEIKGLKGELEVGDLLAKHLPEDTYVISQPMIGKYQPDFLVISPRYGFRIIEVKNWSLNPIQDVHSNGVFTILNKTYNPLLQVRNHVDDLKGYLISNYPQLNDPYKLIGYLIIQYGFNRSDMERFVKGWDKGNAKDFFDFHLFKDDLNVQLDSRLAMAAKFRDGGLERGLIEEIVANVRSLQSELSETDFYNLVRTEEINKNIHEKSNSAIQSKQRMEEKEYSNVSTVVRTPIQKSNNGSRRIISGKMYLLMAVAVCVGIVAVDKLSTSDLNDDYDSGYISDDFVEISDLPYMDGVYMYDSIPNAFTSPGKKVAVDAKVINFSIDNNSGVKFLELEVEGFLFNAVIFKEIEVPYINEMEVYRVFGTTKEYNGAIELEVANIEEL